MPDVIKKFLKAFLFLSFGLIILFLVYKNQNTAFLAQCELDGIPAEDCSLISKILQDFSEARYAWILLIVFLFFWSNVHRAWRWQLLLKPIKENTSFWNALWTIQLGYLANLGLPRLGEVIRPATFGRYEKLPFEKVIGTVAVSRAVDLLSLAIIIVLAIVLEYDIMWSYLMENANLGGKFNAGLLATVFVILGFLGLISIFLLRRYRDTLLQKPIYLKLENMVLGFWNGLKTIGQLEKPGLFIFHSFVIWFMYYLMTYLCFYAYVPTSVLGPLAGLVTLVFGSLGMVIPSPGGMGTYHFLTTSALVIYGLNSSDAFSFANLIFFSIQIFGVIFLGLISLIVLPIINKSD